jgi:hypothetical protein
MFNKYFEDSPYYNMVNEIFINLDNKHKENIKKYYFNTTKITLKLDSKNLSYLAYKSLCNSVILKSSNDGNCFFKAVADGINISNYSNQIHKIIYANYGKTQLFTISILREIVSTYIQNKPKEELNEWLNASEIYVKPLNDAFNNKIGDNVLSQEQYLEELNYVYNTHENFLIYKPKIVPIDIDLYKRPFRVLEMNEIEQYIKSKDYWANNVAIDALCKILHLNIIPIEKYKDKNNLYRLRTLVHNFDIESVCKKKVMFLLYDNNHYELIRFKFNLKNITHTENIPKSLIYKTVYFTIFENNIFIPPLHILFLFYGSFYSRLNVEIKKQVRIFNNIMNVIDNSMYKVLESKNERFIKTFDSYFPYSKSIYSLLDNKYIENKKPDIVEENLSGGKNTSKELFIKKEKDDSKLEFVVTVYMELHPGTSLLPEDKRDLKCNQKYNMIRKSFSDLIGKPYVIPPVYIRSSKTSKNDKQIMSNKTRKNI